MCWKNFVQGPEASYGIGNLERPCEKSQAKTKFLFSCYWDMQIALYAYCLFLFLQGQI